MNLQPIRPALVLGKATTLMAACKCCRGHVRSDTGFADLHGEAFRDYYCDACAPRVRAVRRDGRYRGYAVTFDRERPVTGRWRGERFGVGLCNGSLGELMRAIDARIQEAQNTGPIHVPAGYVIP